MTDLADHLRFQATQIHDDIADDLLAAAEAIERLQARAEVAEADADAAQPFVQYWAESRDAVLTGTELHAEEWLATHDRAVAERGQP